MSKIEKLAAITHSWDVRGTVPSVEQKYPNYGLNVHVGAEAASMEDALAAARKLYPGIVLFSCHHRGEIHVRASEVL